MTLPFDVTRPDANWFLRVERPEEYRSLTQAEFREKLKQSCDSNSALYLRTCAAVAKYTNSPWLTPGAPFECYSLGKFGELTVDPASFQKLDDYYVEVNDAFKEAMPFATWTPPRSSNHPELAKGGKPKKGITRYSFLDFLGAAVTSYYCDGKTSPWSDLYDHLDWTYRAISCEGDKILRRNGPLESSGFHGHNFIGTMEEIAATARDINKDAVFRPWYGIRPPHWWNKRWRDNFLAEQAKAERSTIFTSFS